jgi:hypothetical protein
VGRWRVVVWGASFPQLRRHLQTTVLPPIMQRILPLGAKRNTLPVFEKARNQQQGLNVDACLLRNLERRGASGRHPLRNQQTRPIRKNCVDLPSVSPPRLGYRKLLARKGMKRVVDPNPPSIPHKWGVLSGSRSATIFTLFCEPAVLRFGARWP